MRFALPERRMLSIMGYDFDDAGRDGGSPRRAGDKAEPYQPKQANGPDATTGEKPRKPSRIKLIPFEQITISDAGEEWLIKGIAPRVGVGVTWGPSQSYKSFLELDQDMHIALGWAYRSRRVQQGPVVYCAFEGGLGVSKRVEAWRRRFLPSDHADPALLSATDAPRARGTGRRSYRGHSRPARRSQPRQGQPRHSQPLDHG